VRRIVCVGNRLVAGDTAGPRVHDLLVATDLPPGIELRDGGLRGLDLVSWIEGTERTVIVDATRGHGDPGEVTVLDPARAAACSPDRMDHGAGVAYALAALEALSAESAPDVVVVGIEEPAGDAAIRRAAKLALLLATAPASAAEER
jgi:hydrogenase maturation protease